MFQSRTTHATNPTQTHKQNEVRAAAHLIIIEQVPVVPVLGLQDETRHRVPGRADDEVIARGLERRAADWPVVLLIHLKKAVVGDLAHLGATARVGHHFDDAALEASGEYAVGAQV